MLLDSQIHPFCTQMEKRRLFEYFIKVLGCNKLYSRDVASSSLYVTGRSVSSGRRRRSVRCVCRKDVAADRGGRFLRGPLQSGVLQQEMQTEFSRPVQNCWYPEEAMRQAPEEAQDFL